MKQDIKIYSLNTDQRLCKNEKDIRTLKCTLKSIADGTGTETPHNNLKDIQGGSEGEYYHLDEYTYNRLSKLDYIIVNSLEERDSIPCDRRRKGMRVLVVTEIDTIEYELDSDSVCQNQWTEIISDVDESTVKLISDYSELAVQGQIVNPGISLNSQLDLNQELKRRVLSLRQDLNNLPEVPENISELNNDVGYITSNDLPAPVDISGKANTNANNLTGADVISWRTALDIYSKGEINGLLNDVVYGSTFRDAIYQLETNKLNIPTPTPVTNTTEYPYIILGKANGNSTAKIAAGDVGKNVANSALTSVTGAKLTLGADWEINVGTGFYFGLKGLLDKSTDATWNRLLMTDSSGRVAYTNGKNLIKGMPSLLTETEMTAWKTQMNGGWTTASMSVGLISPPVMSKTLTTPTWVLLRGANLNLNPANFSIKIMSEDGLTEIATIPNSQVQLQSSMEITFYYNMALLSVGNYKIKINNGVAEYTTALTFNVSTSVEYIDFSGITWETKTYNNVPNPYAFGSQGSASYKTNPNVKPQFSENLIVCAQKSQEIIASNRDFYIEFNWAVGSWGQGGGNNSVFYWGLMPSTSNLELVNQASVYLRCAGRSDTLAKNIFIDLESVVLNSLANGAGTILGTFAIIRRGSIFTMVGSSGSSIRINTKTNGTYGMSLYMANSNTLSAAESSMSVINAYYIN